MLDVVLKADEKQKQKHTIVEKYKSNARGLNNFSIVLKNYFKLTILPVCILSVTVFSIQSVVTSSVEN